MPAGPCMWHRKTLQAITAIAAALLHNRVSSSIRTCLVVVPVNVVHNWVNEWQTWAPIPLRASITVIESSNVTTAGEDRKVAATRWCARLSKLVVSKLGLGSVQASGGENEHRTGAC